MTEFVSVAEAPDIGEEKISRKREIAIAAGTLAAAGLLSEVAELEHWFNHADFLLRFFQDSGKHFVVGYLGALKGISLSKAETFRGKVAAALAGGLVVDAGVEVAQAVAVTGVWHGAIANGRPQDLLGVFAHSQISGNAEDALAAEMAAVAAAWQMNRAAA